MYTKSPEIAMTEVEIIDAKRTNFILRIDVVIGVPAKEFISLRFIEIKITLHTTTVSGLALSESCKSCDLNCTRTMCMFYTCF